MAKTKEYIVNSAVKVGKGRNAKLVFKNERIAASAIDKDVAAELLSKGKISVFDGSNDVDETAENERLASLKEIETELNRLKGLKGEALVKEAEAQNFEVKEGATDQDIYDALSADLRKERDRLAK